VTYPHPHPPNPQTKNKKKHPGEHTVEKRAQVAGSICGRSGWTTDKKKKEEDGRISRSKSLGPYKKGIGLKKRRL